MFGAAAGDVRGDFEPSDLVAVALVVVAVVGVDASGGSAVGRVCLGSAGRLGPVGSAGSRRCGCRRSAWRPAGCCGPRRSHDACCRSCPDPPGTGRWPHHLSSPADGSSRPTPGTDPICRPAASRADAARPRPRSSPAVALWTRTLQPILNALKEESGPDPAPGAKWRTPPPTPARSAASAPHDTRPTPSRARPTLQRPSEDRPDSWNTFAIHSSTGPTSTTPSGPCGPESLHGLGRSWMPTRGRSSSGKAEAAEPATAQLEPPGDPAS